MIKVKKSTIMLITGICSYVLLLWAVSLNHFLASAINLIGVLFSFYFYKDHKHDEKDTKSD
jgi:uncharacterized membrane protein